IFVFFSHYACSSALLALHSFPTRRSSDLPVEHALGQQCCLHTLIRSAEEVQAIPRQKLTVFHHSHDACSLAGRGCHSAVSAGGILRSAGAYLFLSAGQPLGFWRLLSRPALQ